MQRNSSALREEIIHANKLMNISGTTAIDTKQVREALEIYQRVLQQAVCAYNEAKFAADHQLPFDTDMSLKYPNLDLSLRWAMFYNLKEMLLLLPEWREEILEALLKQFSAEVIAIVAKNEKNELLEKICNLIITSAKDRTHFKSLFDKYDDFSKHLKKSRTALTEVQVKGRLSFINSMIEATRTTHETCKIYESILKCYSDLIDDDALAVIIQNLTKLMKEIPEQRKNVLDMLSTQYKAYPRTKILMMLIPEKNRCEELLDFYRPAYYSPESKSNSDGGKVIAPFSSVSLQQLEIFAENVEFPFVKFKAHQLLVEYYNRIDKNQPQPTQQNKIAASCEKLIQLAAGLKQELSPDSLIRVYSDYAKQMSSVKYFDAAAELGDVNSRLSAADLTLKTAPSQAVPRYVQGLKEALRTNQNHLVISFLEQLFDLKRQHIKTLTPENNKAIESVVLFTFKHSSFRADYNIKDPLSLMQKLSDFSAESADLCIEELYKKYGQYSWFLEFAEGYYAAKIKESNPEPFIISGFALYPGLKHDLDKRIADDVKKVKALGRIVSNPKNQTPAGKLLRNAIYDYFRDECFFSCHSTQYEVVKAEFVAILQDYLDKNKMEHVYLDLIALLDVRFTHKNAIRIHEELVDCILKNAEKVEFPSLTHYEQSARRYMSEMFACYSYLNFCSTLETLSSDSPFYRFTEVARRIKSIFQYKLKASLYSNFTFNSFKNSWKVTPHDYSVWGPLSVSRLFSCPIAISDVVNKTVPNWYSVKAKNRLALLACANLLVLNTNQNLMNEVAITSAGLNLEGLLFGRISVRGVLLNTSGDDVFHDKNKILAEFKQRISSSLKEAISKAKEFLYAKAKNPKYEYYNLAKWLVEFVAQAEQATRPISDPIVFLWVKMRQSGIKPEDKKHFEHGLLRLISDDEWELLPGQQGKWFAFLDDCVDASKPGFGVLKQIVASAPELEKKQDVIASAPEFEDKQVFVASATEFDHHQFVVASVPVLEHKQVVVASAPELEMPFEPLPLMAPVVAPNPTPIVADEKDQVSELKQEEGKPALSPLKKDIVLDMSYSYPLPPQWDPDLYAKSKLFPIEGEPAVEMKGERSPKEEKVVVRMIEGRSQVEGEAAVEVIGEKFPVEEKAVVEVLGEKIPVEKKVIIEAVEKKSPVEKRVIAEMIEEKSPTVSVKPESAPSIAQQQESLSFPEEKKPAIEIIIPITNKELINAPAASSVLPNQLIESEEGKSESTSAAKTEIDSEPGATNWLSFPVSDISVASSPFVFPQEHKRSSALIATNPIEANIEVSETQPGILSLIAQITSATPAHIAFAILNKHILFQHHGITPIKISEPCIYLDAPPGLTLDAAQTVISLNISKPNLNGFRLVSTTVTSSETAALTPVSLNLSLFSQKKQLSGNASFASDTWVKTDGEKLSRIRSC